ncbi:MAG: histidine phosphatase family protein [Haloferacaceae archaeon]
MATVLLARHGETAWNRDGRVQGWAPTGLTDRGREEARALAARVGRERDPDRLVASDLRRAQATADRIAAATGVSVTTDERWRERRWGRFRGRSAADIYEQYPRFSLDDDADEAMAARPAGGESLRETRARVLDAWADLRASLAPDATAVVVTHAVPAAVVRAAARDLDPAAAILEGGHATGAVVELDASGGRARSATGAG